MRHAPTALAAALAVVSLATVARAAPPVDELRALAHETDLAQMHGDKAALDRLVADDFLMVNGSGARSDKAQLIAGFTDPAVTLEPYGVDEAFLVPVGDDAALLGGLVTMKGLDHGKPYSQTFRYADTWMKRNDRWQVVFTQLFKVKP